MVLSDRKYLMIKMRYILYMTGISIEMEHLRFSLPQSDNDGTQGFHPAIITRDR